MKKVANAPIMPATTTSIAMMPMLVAIAIGELLSPKQTGQASAARGAARSIRVKIVFRISSRSAEAFALQRSGFPLERRAVDAEAEAARQRRRARHGVAD